MAHSPCAHAPDDSPCSNFFSTSHVKQPKKYCLAVGGADRGLPNEPGASNITGVPTSLMELTAFWRFCQSPEGIRIGYELRSVIITIRPAVIFILFDDEHSVLRSVVAEFVLPHIGGEQLSVRPFQADGVSQAANEGSFILPIGIHL